MPAQAVAIQGEFVLGFLLFGRAFSVEEPIDELRAFGFAAQRCRDQAPGGFVADQLSGFADVFGIG